MADDVKTGAPVSGLSGKDPQNVNGNEPPVNTAPAPAQSNTVKPGMHQRAHLIQRAGEQTAGEASDAIINAAEQAAYDRDEAERRVAYDQLPAATIAEMEAGRSALKRHAPTTSAPAAAAQGEQTAPTAKA